MLKLKTLCVSFCLFTKMLVRAQSPMPLIDQMLIESKNDLIQLDERESVARILLTHVH